MNVLSIGDSTVERTAITEVMWSSQYEAWVRMLHEPCSRLGFGKLVVHLAAKFTCVDNDLKPFDVPKWPHNWEVWAW